MIELDLSKYDYLTTTSFLSHGHREDVDLIYGIRDWLVESKITHTISRQGTYHRGYKDTHIYFEHEDEFLMFQMKWIK